jgi:branched-chain amino acid transport system ATP-binding protein
MLRIRNLDSYYGRLQVLKGVSMHIDEGEIVTLIGANGAGKTTLLNSISGLITEKSGEIEFGGKNLMPLSADRVVRRGISQVPEGRQIFSTLTVRDNLQLGAYIRPRSRRKEIAQDLEKIYEQFPVLAERKKQLAGTLSGGEQQMLSIGRALMAKPRLLLLDEPSMGLAPKIVTEIFAAITRLREENGTTILLVEQNARAAFRIAERGYVMETGRIIIQETIEELKNNKEVQRAYLGKDKGE